MIKVYKIEDCFPIQDTCGTIYELFNSQNLSISISKIKWKSIPHYHKKMEEMYYILSWKWLIFIGEETLSIKKWDLIPIPKNKYHHIESSDIEILVITHPKFSSDDVLI